MAFSNEYPKIVHNDATIDFNDTVYKIGIRVDPPKITPDVEKFEDDFFSRFDVKKGDYMEWEIQLIGCITQSDWQSHFALLNGQLVKFYEHASQKIYYDCIVDTGYPFQSSRKRNMNSLIVKIKTISPIRAIDTYEMERYETYAGTQRAFSGSRRAWAGGGR